MQRKILEATRGYVIINENTNQWDGVRRFMNRLDQNGRTEQARQLQALFRPELKSAADQPCPARLDN